MVFIPPLVVLIFLGIGCYVNRDQIFQIARVLQNQKTFSTPAIIKAPFVPADQSNAFDPTTLRDSIERLVLYARSVRPDWILGVHPGGRLLSVLVAEQLQLPRENCLYIRTTSHDSKRVVVEPVLLRNEPSSGRMLVIDDISRTGDTLNVVKSFLLRKNFCGSYALTKVFFAVLLIVSHDGEDYEFRPNWIAYKTKNEKFRLPWGKFSVAVQDELTLKHSGRPYSEKVVEQYFKIISNYDYALEMAKEVLDSAALST